MLDAENLLEAGVRELLIVSQDTSAYGVDVKYRTGFWRGRPVKTRMTELVRALGELAGAHGAWVRLHYVYPYPHVDEVIPLMAEAKILPYLDVPFQHASPRILKRMKRPANAQNNLERIQAWRSICPDITIRSTFIVGFPGESDAEFEELLAFSRAQQFERVGVFPYSLEPGTPAERLPNHLPEAIKMERRNRLMEAQQQVAFAWSQRQIGRELQVIIDGLDPEVPNHALARSYADSPDIDGLVRVKGKNLHAGDLVRVKVTGADGYDLVARAVSQGR